MTSLRLLVVSASVLAAVAPGGTPKSREVGPPGNSGVDQVRESGPAVPSGARTITPAERRALQRQGPDGARLAGVLERFGGVPSGKASAGGSTADAGDTAGERSLVAAAATAKVGPAPMWAFLAAAPAAVAAGLGLRRRRAR